MAKKILIVDDDKINSKILHMHLTKHGYEVEAAYDGDIGLEKLKEIGPDLILLDVKMPSMDGYTFIMHLRKIPEYRKIPVIIQTSLEEMQPIFRLNDVRHFFVKPLDLPAVLGKVKECLGE